MNNARKALIRIFLSIIIVSTLVHTVLSQKNETIDRLQQENKTTTAQNATFSEVAQKSEVTKEDILIEAQRSLDRSLSILNIVATLIGVLIAIIAIIITIAAAVGFFQLSKWKAIIKDAEREANTIRESRKEVEKYAEEMRKDRENIPTTLTTEKPSKEAVEKLDEFSRRLELLEVLGVSLKPEDYLQRGNDLYYKGKYELALKAYEKTIELKPDYAEVWNNKGVALGELNRYEEALKAFDKAIELKSDYAEAWSNKGAALGEFNRHEEAFKAYGKAIELKPDYAKAWFNRACAYSIKRNKEKVLSDLKKAIELDKSYKEKTKTDKDFEWLWDDKDFKKLVN